MRSLGREGDALLEFMQLPFLLQQIRDIYTGADIPAEISARPKSRHSAVRYKAIFAVMASKAILHHERLTRIKRRDVRLKTLLEVIEMDSFRPAITEF